MLTVSYLIYIWRIFIFTTFLVSLFLFTTIKETFSKLHFLLSGKKLLYHCSIYIYKKYLNKKYKKKKKKEKKWISLNLLCFMFLNYTFSNPNFSIIFELFFLILFKNRKTLVHPSTINPKSRLINSMVVNVFYPSLKVKVKVVNVNMKNDTMNVVFLTITLYIR